MPSFSLESLDQLKTCHPDLIRLFTEVIKYYDCTIIEGFRNKEQQEKMFNKHWSQVHFPQSMHNRYLSRAVDAKPVGIDYDKLDKMDWKEWCQFYHFIGFVKATAINLGIKVRCGGDWDGDMNIRDQKFYDLPHFEIPE